jgi:hypothetical protein
MSLGRDGSRRLGRCAGRGGDESFKQIERLARCGDRSDPAKRVEGATALRAYLCVDECADSQLVEDLAYLLDALAR